MRLHSRTFPIALALICLSVQVYPQTVEVSMVELHGAVTLTDSERSELKKALIGTTSSQQWLDALRDEVTRRLHDQGFLAGKVTLTPHPESTRGDLGRALLIATINEGPRFRVAQIWWAGSTSLSLRELNQAALLKPGDVFRPSLVMKSDKLIRTMLAERGFPRAAVMSQWRLLPEFSEAHLHVEIREGPRGSSARDSHSLTTPPRDAARVAPDSCASAPQPSPSAKFPLTLYDPKRDGAADIAAALTEGQRTSRRVLVVVGGDWCAWCRVLEETFDRDAALTAARDRHYVTVYLNFSEENLNDCAFARFPVPKTFPMIYVLDSSGALVADDNSSDWQFAGGYDPRRIEAFLLRHAVSPGR